MSWFNVDVTDDKWDSFEIAFMLAFNGKWPRPDTEVNHYKIIQKTDGNSLLELHRSSSKDTKLLPYQLKVMGALDFCKHWLENATYPEAPKTDGSTKKGWRISTPSPFGTPMVAIETKWIIYSK